MIVFSLGISLKYIQPINGDHNNIEYSKGETRTYKEIAIAIGHPLAVRAVANACGKNPYPIKIPCHRVIRSDGKLGGYSAPGGIAAKRRLLKEELKT